MMEGIDNQLHKEMVKNQTDKMVSEMELLKDKLDVISKMDKDWFEEITKQEDYNKPIKIRKPFKLKFSEFLYKLKKVFGN